jgi:hypothetical protein
MKSKHTFITAGEIHHSPPRHHCSLIDGEPTSTAKGS